MFNHIIQPSSISAGQPLEGVQAIAGYTSRERLQTLLPAFTLGEESDEGDGAGRNNWSTVPETRPVDGSTPDLFKLAINVSFQELIRYFLIPEHDKILSIRARLRAEQGVDSITIFTPAKLTHDQAELVREHLYEVQMQLLSTSKGLHCHLIL